MKTTVLRCFILSTTIGSDCFAFSPISSYTARETKLYEYEKPFSTYEIRTKESLVSAGAVSTATDHDSKVTCDNRADISKELLLGVAQSHERSKAHVNVVTNGF